MTVNTFRSVDKLAQAAAIALAYAVLAWYSVQITYAKDLPSWVQTPPTDSKGQYYGIGQGKSLPTATQSALESIAGKLMTEVESDLTIATEVEDNVAKSAVASEIRSQVAKTNLANYTVEATEKIGSDFFVLINVQRQAVWQANQDALTELTAEIDHYFDRLNKKSVLSVTEEQTVISDKIQLARSKALISRSLNPNYDHTSVSNKLRHYQTLLQAKVEDQSIYIVSSAELAPLAQRIAHQLTNEGFTTTLTKPSGKTPTIHLEGNFKEYDQFNQKHVTARTAIRVVDEFQKAIFTSEVVLNGASMMSYDSAKTIAVNRYMKELELQGVAASFGLANE